MHHIFVNDKNVNISNKIIEISAKDDFENYNHLANALRVKLGEFVLCSVEPFTTSFDYKTKVIGIDKENILLQIEESVEGRELPITVNLYQGLCKSDKLEFIIEKAVELGAKTIIPLETKNSVVKFDINEKKSLSKIERYNKISKSAAEQSKRHIIPEVLKPKDFINLEILKNENVFNLLFYENENDITKTRKVLDKIKNTKDAIVNIFVGPEGGWTDEEVKFAKENNFYILTLGSRILRTETAAITALSIVAYEIEK